MSKQTAFKIVTAFKIHWISVFTAMAVLLATIQPAGATRALLRLRCQLAGLKLSPDRVLAEFAPWSVVDLTLTGGTHVRQVALPTDLRAQVMTALGVPAYERYLTSLASPG